MGKWGSRIKWGGKDEETKNKRKEGRASRSLPVLGKVRRWDMTGRLGVQTDVSHSQGDSADPWGLLPGRRLNFAFSP